MKEYNLLPFLHFQRTSCLSAFLPIQHLLNRFLVCPSLYLGGFRKRGHNKLSQYVCVWEWIWEQHPWLKKRTWGKRSYKEASRQGRGTGFSEKLVGSLWDMRNWRCPVSIGRKHSGHGFTERALELGQRGPTGRKMRWCHPQKKEQFSEFDTALGTWKCGF